MGVGIHQIPVVLVELAQVGQRLHRRQESPEAGEDRLVILPRHDSDVGQLVHQSPDEGDDVPSGNGEGAVAQRPGTSIGHT